MCYTDIPNEAIQFFVIFSQFEYLLKRLKYAKQDNPGGYVSIKWRDFANKVEDITKNDLVKDSMIYYFEKPPAKFILNDVDHNPWEDRGPINPEDRNNEKLLELIRDVRNNLFHGEKPELVFGGNDMGRSKDLLEHGLIIITNFFKLAENLNE